VSRCTVEDGAGGRMPDRKQDEVRRLLDSPHPPVPTDLALRALERGRRLETRRHLLRALLVVVLLAAVIAAAIALAAAAPWAGDQGPQSPPPVTW
jgi:ferric-dicitrate binding protein FerR (iron transport regulator)